MPRYTVCGQCGAVLTGKHKYMDLRDQCDCFEKYHSLRIDLCEDCFAEIIKKREAVLESVKKDLEGCQCEDYTMTEF